MKEDYEQIRVFHKRAKLPLYSLIFVVSLQHMMLVNIKLDIS